MRGTIRGADERARLLAAYDTGGLSARTFAEREGIPLSTFYGWLVARRPRKPRASFPRVARVVCRPSPPAVSTALVLALGAARVEVPRGFDRDTLCALLDILAARMRQAET